jgi:hypothetical protein
MMLTQVTRHGKVQRLVTTGDVFVFRLLGGCNVDIGIKLVVCALMLSDCCTSKQHVEHFELNCF